MIDTRFIESAREIRKEYLRLSEELDKNQNNVKELAIYLEGKIEELKEFQESLKNKIKSKEQIMDVTKNLLIKIGEIEDREKSMTKSIDEVNKKIINLRSEEFLLMKKIKEKYPELSSDEIKKEVHSKL